MALRAWTMLVLILAASSAAAQAPVPSPTATRVEVLAGAPDAALVPLGPFVTVPLTIRYTFLHALPMQESTMVTLRVGQVPAFLVATVSPEALSVGSPELPCACERTVEVGASLLVSATHEAPAFRPARVLVVAQAAENGPYEASEGEGAAEVVPDFHSQVEARAASSIARIPPGGSLALPLTVVNLANAPSRFTFRLAETPVDLEVEVPSPVEVPSILGKDGRHEAPVEVVVRAPPSDGFVNRVHALTLLVDSAHAGEPPRPGDDTLVSLLVTVKSDAPVATPDASVGLLALALAFIAVIRRR